MTSGMVHVSQDLSTSNSDTIGTCKYGLGNMTTKLEPGRHVREETSLMGEVDQFEGIFEAELEDLAISLTAKEEEVNVQYTRKDRCPQHHRR